MLVSSEEVLLYKVTHTFVTKLFHNRFMSGKNILNGHKLTKLNAVLQKLEFFLTAILCYTKISPLITSEDIKQQNQEILKNERFSQITFPLELMYLATLCYFFSR